MKETREECCPGATSPAKKSAGCCCGGSHGTRLAALVAILLASVAALGYAGVFDGLSGKSPAAVAKAAGVTETADAVKVPLKSLDSGKALFLSMQSEGKDLHFFALRSPDGKYRAALDACDVCFRANKGYRQEGDRMVCNNCGQAFRVRPGRRGEGGVQPPSAGQQSGGGTHDHREVRHRVGQTSTSPESGSRRGRGDAMNLRNLALEKPSPAEIARRFHGARHLSRDRHVRGDLIPDVPNGRRGAGQAGPVRGEYPRFPPHGAVFPGVRRYFPWGDRGRPVPASPWRTATRSRRSITRTASA